jgi:class 3 adenylate cyclase
MDESTGSGAPEDLPDGGEHMLHSWAGEEVACLISDMSGFTKLTRKHGIIHFASIIARFRQITMPIMKRYGALLITTEADSFNCVFPNVATALLAANDMHRHVGEANRLLPPERAHFLLTLDGIGVDLGPGPILDKAGKLHGRTFMNAHILGEELCTKGSVALSSRARDAAQGLPEFAGATWKPFDAAGHEDNEEVQAALTSMGSVFEMSLPSTDPIVLPGVDSTGSVQAALLPFAKRHCMEISDADRDALDSEIRAKSMVRKAVLMFDFGFEGADDPTVQVGLKYSLLARFERVFETYHGEGLEDVLVTFDHPANALLAALACRRIAAKGGPDSGPSIMVQGYGIHFGEILFVPGTDIHWGDPVNTASKLGQDEAEDGQIIISEVAQAAISEDVRLAPYEFVPRECTLSGVLFNAFEVWDKEIEAKDKKDLIIQEFKKAEVPPSLELEKATLAKVITTLSPRFTQEEIDRMFDGIARPGSSTISLEAFLDKGCSKFPPGICTKSSRPARPRTS